ncbi:trigger factor [Candidatus Azambacteria bacterium]|nr:trigger factor [Candidatus Azambacteria bacterium]
MEGVVCKKLPKSQVMFEVTAQPEEVANAEIRALGKLGAGIELKGFRKGKAPADMVRRHIGEERLFQEACFLLMDEKYAQIVKEFNVRTAGQPKVEVKKMAKGNPLVFTVTVAVYPEVTLPDYKDIARSLKKERMPVMVTDDEVKGALEWIAQSRRKEALVSRAAKQGDLVEINFESRIGGVKMDGGESRSHPFIVGKSKFADGFDAHIEGMEPGAEKEFSLRISPEHGRAEIRGKPVDFKVKMNAVYEITLPELDDAFAQSLGKFENAAALARNIKENLQQEKEAQEKETFRSVLAKAIAARTQAEIADILIDEETDKMFSEMTHGLRERGLDLDGYLASVKKTKEEFRTEVRPQAETRVKIALALGEIAKKEHITVSPEEVNEQALRILEKRDESVRRMDMDLLSRYVSGIIRNEKVFALLENA